MTLSCDSPHGYGMGGSAPQSRKSTLLARTAQVYEHLRSGKRKLATAAAAVLAIGVGYHVVFGANGIIVYEQKRHETHILNQQMVELQRENAQLKQHVDRLQSDPDAIEHQAREQLHYTRPGEVVYALPAK